MLIGYRMSSEPRHYEYSVDYKGHWAANLIQSGRTTKKAIAFPASVRDSVLRLLVALRRIPLL